MILVVDASVAAMWFVAEPQSDVAALLFDPSYDLVAPDLIRLEVGNALLKAVRRRALFLDDARGAVARLAPPAITLLAASEHADAALRIADVHGLSIYDGVYVAVAQSLQTVVVTNDARLAKGANSAGVRAAMVGSGPSGWAMPLPGK